MLCYVCFQVERWMNEKAKAADQINFENEMVARYMYLPKSLKNCVMCKLNMIQMHKNYFLSLCLTLKILLNLVFFEK